jgi:hypothetical protein
MERLLSAGRTFLFSAFLSLLLVLFASEEAFAYIDPASGSYILQLILAGLLGAAFAIKMMWRRIRAFVGRLLGGSKDTESGSDG